MAVGASALALPGVLAGRYRVLGPVGRGAIAEVVRARDEQSGDEVALKILYPHLRESAVVVERFRREVDIVRRIAHPHVLALREVTESEGHLFLVMDYHPGGDLADRLARDRRLPSWRILTLAEQLCGALAAAHRAGVVHRDVKPSNVLYGPGDDLDVRLCDFGLARTAELAGLTTANAVLGTPEYMAPEIVTDGHADPRSDIYSLGAMLFEAATGRLPFYGDSPYQLMRQHLDVEAPRARSLVPELPAAIDEAIARALAKDPLDRFATADDLARALRADAPDSSAAIAIGRRPEAVARVCGRCGGWFVEAGAVCVDCGVASLRLEYDDAGMHVLVTGPGDVDERVDAARHVALYKLLDELPASSVRKKPGRRRAPRYPFYVARALTQKSAEALAERLVACGFKTRISTYFDHADDGITRRQKWKSLKHALFAMSLNLPVMFLLPVLPGAWKFLPPTLMLASIVAGCVLGWVQVTRPIARRPTRRDDEAITAEQIGVLLSQLANRQDRRLVAHLLARLKQTRELGQPEAAGLLTERASLVVAGLVALDRRSDATGAEPGEAAGALDLLRRKEVARVASRADLLRLTSRLDALCARLARAGALGAPNDAADIEAEIQELIFALEAEDDMARLLGDGR